MPKIKVRNLKNEDVGEIELSDNVFGAEVKQHLIQEIVRMQQNRKRSGTACTKERNAVAGGGRKPYRQKGTGRARQGTLSAPNHVGGGVVFGPRPRSYDFSPPKKVRRGAMCSALSLFFNENRLIVIKDFKLKNIKTRNVEKVLDTFDIDSALVVDRSENENLRLSTRNLAGYQFLPPEGLNVYDILRHNKLVITERAVCDVQDRLERAIGSRRATK